GAAVDLFGLVEADNAFRERVIVRIPGAADRWLDPSPGQALGVPDREILHPTIAVVDQSLRAVELPIVERLLECIEGQVAPQRTRHTPADDPTGTDVDHEGDIREAPP